MIKRLAAIALREARINLNYRVSRRRADTPAASQGTDGPRRIGLVRLDLIGDFVLFTAAAPHLRKAFPNAELTLFGHPAWRDLAVWLNDHGVASDPGGLFEKFVAVDPARLVERPYFAAHASQLSAMDLVINSAFSRSNAVDKLLAASGRRSLAWEGDTTNILAWQKTRNDALYTRLLPNTTSLTEWERNLDLVVALAPNAPPHVPPQWRVDHDSTTAALSRFGEELAAPFVAISPFASLTIKQWPLDRYEVLIRRILEHRPDLRVVILGGADAARHAKRLAACGGSTRRVVDLTGRTTLVEAACILSQARVSISGDTAAGHLASALGTPAVVIMGGGHYGRFFPYPAPHPTGSNSAVTHPMPCFNCNWFCKYRRYSEKEPPCLQNITVDEVFAQIGSV